MYICNISAGFTHWLGRLKSRAPKNWGFSGQGVYYFWHYHWAFMYMLLQRTVLSKQPFFKIALHSCTPFQNFVEF